MESIQVTKSHHVNRQSYKCSLCGSYFSALSTLEFHKKICKSKPVEKSDLFEVLTPAEFETQKGFCLRQGKFICIACGHSSISIENILQHVKANHPRPLPTFQPMVDGDEDTSITEVKIPKKTKVKVIALNFKVDTTSNQEQYSCTLCSMNFDCTSTLYNHLKSHEENQSEPYCHLDTSNEYLEEPSDISPVDDIKETDGGFYQCKICFKSFHQFTSLRSHWNEAHKKICNNCKKSYVDYENEGGREKCKKCDFCNKIFDTFLKLRLHLEGFHMLKYECDYCKLIPRNIWSYHD